MNVFPRLDPGLKADARCTGTGFPGRVSRYPVFLLAASLVLLSSCLGSLPKHPLPVNGVLDLRGWDFQRNGTVSAEGYWEFRFGEFLAPAAFDTSSTRCYAWMPGVWSDPCVCPAPGERVCEKRVPAGNEPRYGAHGYASYRLTLLLPPRHGAMGFRIGDMGTSYRLWLNDSLVASSGTPGTTRETTRPQVINHFVRTGLTPDTLHLTLHIANFHYRKGGPWKDIVFGDLKTMESGWRDRLGRAMLISGLWLAVCMVLISFFIFRTRERSVLFLFLWALSLLVRVGVADDRILLDFLPGFPFGVLIRMEYLAGFGIVPFSIMALRVLFPREIPAVLRDVAAWAYLVHAVIIIAAPIAFSSWLVVPFFALDILLMVIVAWRMGLAVIHRREGAIIIGLGYIIVIALYSIQFLYYTQALNLPLGAIITLGGFTLAFAQVLILARMFSSAISRVENFAVELEQKVDNRTRQLVEVQEQLIAAARQAETDNVRRRISQDIHDDISSGLNRISWMGELIKIRAQKYTTEELNAALDRIITSSRETVDNLVEIIWSLNPSGDDLENLLAFMRHYINRFFEDSAFSVQVRFPETIPKTEINPELKRNIFLVLKEALHNAAKYSRADTITVDFALDGEHYRLSVADNGIGMEAGVVQGTGNGMINMQKRAEQAGALFTLASAPGQGTRVILEGKLYS